MKNCLRVSRTQKLRIAGVLVLAAAAPLAAWWGDDPSHNMPVAIHLQSHPWAVTLVPANDRLFVLGHNMMWSMEMHADSLTVLDSRTGAVLQERLLAPEPTSGADNPLGPAILDPGGPIMLRYSDKVERLDPGSGALLGRLPANVVPDIVDASTRHMFALSRFGPCPSIAMLHARSAASLRTTPLLTRCKDNTDQPSLLLDSPARRLVALLYTARSIVLLDTRSGAIVRTIRLPMSPAFATLAGPGSLVAIATVLDHFGLTCENYVCRGGDGVVVDSAEPVQGSLLLLDAARGDGWRTTPFTGFPTGMLANPARSRLYVIVRRELNGGPLSLLVFGGRSGTLLAAVPLPDSGSSEPIAMSLNPLTGHLLIPNGAGDQLLVIDPDSGATLASVPAGHRPAAVTIDTRSGMAFVADTCDPLGPLPTPTAEVQGWLPSWLHQHWPFGPARTVLTVDGPSCGEGGITVLQGASL